MRYLLPFIIAFFIAPSAWGFTTITVDDPTDSTIIQRQSGVGTISLTGTYTGGVTTVAARAVDDGTSDEHLTWTTLTNQVVAGGVWSGDFEGVPEGGWLNVDVRDVSNPSTVTDLSSTTKWGVGRLILTIGQSNMAKWFLDGTDATADILVRWYNESGWSDPTTTGNGANAFANALVADEPGIPVGLLDYAVGGTTLLPEADFPTPTGHWGKEGVQGIDNFNRPNNNSVGGDWTENIDGSWEIVSNKLKLTGDATWANNRLDRSSEDWQDGTSTIDWIWPSSVGTSVQLHNRVRGTGSNDFEYGWSDKDNLYVGYHRSGGSTTLATTAYSTALVADVNYRLRVETRDDIITAKVWNLDTDTLLATATHTGTIADISGFQRLSGEGSGLVTNFDNYNHDQYTLHDTAMIGVDALGGVLEGVVYIQGESDAIYGISEAVYEAALVDYVANQIQAEITNGSSESTLPFIYQVMGQCNVTETDAECQAIRNAHIDAESQITGGYISGHNLTLGYSDAWHYDDAGDTTSGETMALAFEFFNDNVTVYTNPSIYGWEAIDASTIDVYITHTGGADFTPTTGITGFEAFDDGSPITISTAIKRGRYTIRLGLATPYAGVFTLRYLYGMQPTRTSHVDDDSSVVMPLQESSSISEQTPVPPTVLNGNIQ